MPLDSRSGFLALAFASAAAFLSAASPPSAETLLAATISSLKDTSGPQAVVLWNEQGRLRHTRSAIDEAEKAYHHALELDDRQENPSKI